MMFPAHLGNERSEYVITDFAQTFERETGLPMTSCREIVEDSHSIFHSFSIVLISLIVEVELLFPKLKISNGSFLLFFGKN